MIKVREVIVVEGRYDKAALASYIDGVVVCTEGFGIFSDSEKLNLLRRAAEKRGLIIMTDPDSAGFVIRAYLKGAIDPALVKHAYIPDIHGRERRKERDSREGLLGVEGVGREAVELALRRAGATIETEGSPRAAAGISKADMYSAGLSGSGGSERRREQLKKRLRLPARLTANSLLDVLNLLMTREEFFALAAGLDGKLQ